MKKIVRVCTVLSLCCGSTFAGISPNQVNTNHYDVIYDGTALQEVLTDFNVTVPRLHVTLQVPHSADLPVVASRTNVPWQEMLSSILMVHGLALAVDLGSPHSRDPGVEYYYVVAPPYYLSQRHPPQHGLLLGGVLIVGFVAGLMASWLGRRKTANKPSESVR